MAGGWQQNLQRWSGAGLLDPGSVERIRAHEAEHEGETRLRWPVLLAWSFGGVLVGAGVLLFVAAHWENLSPAQRFTSVLAMVAAFHVAGALAAGYARALGTVLHAVGTVSLGAGVFLAGQIFHLQEHWPGGVMLWALGAAVAVTLLRDPAQAALVALLTPTWLAGEWMVATQHYRGHHLALASGLTLLAVVYFTAPGRDRNSDLHRALMWIGGLALIPTTLYLALQREGWGWAREGLLPSGLSAAGWILALALPLALGIILCRRGAWLHLVTGAWVLLLGSTTRMPKGPLLAEAWRELGPYLLCGLFSVALVWWGLNEARRERINMGIAGFGLTVLFFYFASVMDKLGRSLSLISLGLLFLFLGWGLHRTRRALLARLESAENEVRL